jgi:hypothetical protein
MARATPGCLSVGIGGSTAYGPVEIPLRCAADVPRDLAKARSLSQLSTGGSLIASRPV